MAESPEYPKAAFRLGGDVDVWGRMMFVRSLPDKQAEVDALANGWFLHPNDVPEGEPEDAVEDAPSGEPVKRGPGRPRKVEG